MLLSADNESDLTRAKAPGNWRPDPRASQVVLGFDAPMLALNLRRSFFVSGVAYHATGLKFLNRTPEGTPRASICGKMVALTSGP